jgi:predicted RNA-binding protein (virulence factor B family)
MPKTEKNKEDRLKETMNLLQQLQENGVKKTSLSFLDLQKKMGAWVQTGISADYVVPFPEYGREAIVSLPRYDNKAATIAFNVKK